MSERPILFSSGMVRAINRGLKTQTRRVAKFWTEKGWEGGTISAPRIGAAGRWLQSAFCSEGEFVGEIAIRCPYGDVGDRLWVRETWAPADEWADNIEREDPTIIAYAADGRVLCVEDPDNKWLWDGWEHYAHWHKTKGRKWRPSIYMPRWASRLTLRVESVRVERLCAISDEDALAEGVDPDGVLDGGFPVNAFARLWDSINGKRASWASNPWVWVVTFSREGADVP